MDEHEQVGRVLLKVVTGEQLKAEEQELLASWMSRSPHNRSVYKEITDPGSLGKKLEALRDYDRDALWDRIRKAIHRHSAKVVW
jgi:hypothetical protein